MDPSDIDELCEIEQARFDLARELFLGESWDHFFVLFSSTDWIGHQVDRLRALRRSRRSPAAAPPLPPARRVRRLVRRARAGLSRVLLSDHGQCEEEAVVRVNAVLRDLGLVSMLGLRTGIRIHSSSAGAGSLERRSGSPRRSAGTALNPVIRPVAVAGQACLRRGLGVELTRASYAIDRAASRAFSPTDASFAIYARDADGEACADSRCVCSQCSLPDGRPAIDDVWTPEELYGRRGPFGPSVLFSPAHGVRPSAMIKDSVVDPAQAPGRGCHQRDGILIVGGAHAVRAIWDAARSTTWRPRCSGRWEQASRAGGDGRVLFEAFDELLATQPVREVDGGWVEAEPQSSGYSDEVARRLRALGYI